MSKKCSYLEEFCLNNDFVAYLLVYLWTKWHNLGGGTFAHILYWQSHESSFRLSENWTNYVHLTESKGGYAPTVYGEGILPDHFKSDCGPAKKREKKVQRFAKSVLENCCCELPTLHNVIWPDIIISPLTARVVGAPQMILRPVFSIFPCSPLPSWTCRIRPVNSLMMSSHLFLRLPCLLPPFTVPLQDGFGQTWCMANMTILL